MPPSNKRPVLIIFQQDLRVNNHRQLDLWSDGHSQF